MWISQVQIKNNMGGGWCQPPCATSDGGLEATAPQCQPHGASLLHLLLGTPRAQGCLLELLTGLTTSGVHDHVTSGLEQLLGSHFDHLGSGLGRVAFLAPDEHSMAPLRAPWKPLCATCRTVTVSQGQSIKKEPRRALCVYSGQAAILIKKTSTPAITIIVTNVIVTNTQTKLFFHVIGILQIPTNVEELGVEGEVHGVFPTTPKE